MPSFDIVSEVDQAEVTNAVDQANRELTTRYDFRGVDAKFERSEDIISLTAEADIQLTQMLDILRSKLIKRSIDPRVMDEREPERSGKLMRQSVGIKQGLDKDLARKIVKMIKDQKMKVQSAIQGEQVRVTAKKRDDLQAVISMLKETDLDIPLQFDNFRD